MTLSVGDHVVKLDKDGKPLTTDTEVYIEYEVKGITGSVSIPGDLDQIVLYGTILKKVK